MVRFSPLPRGVTIARCGEPEHRADEDCNENVRCERQQTRIKGDGGRAEIERVQRLEIVQPGEPCATREAHHPAGEQAVRPEPTGVEAENQGRKGLQNP